MHLKANSAFILNTVTDFCNSLVERLIKQLIEEEISLIFDDFKLIFSIGNQCVPPW
jgi:hypothetical protein